MRTKRPRWVEVPTMETFESRELLSVTADIDVSGSALGDRQMTQLTQRSRT
jgi:hypothetical protein